MEEPHRQLPLLDQTDECELQEIIHAAKEARLMASDPRDTRQCGGVARAFRQHGRIVVRQRLVMDTPVERADDALARSANHGDI
eukprot:scaffold22350_cov33-Tisochrysis_lutea.AAC.1